MNKIWEETTLGWQVIMGNGDDWPTTSLGLIAAVRDGVDTQAWERFAETYGRVLLRFCQKRRLQLADAQDVVQQVFLELIRQIGLFEYAPERGRFRSWLATIALRAIIKHQLRARRHGGGDFSTVEALYADDASLVVDFNNSVLETALETIRPEFSVEEWQAFEQVWLKDAKPQAVASAMSKTPSWVYRAKYKVLQRLKVEVERLLPDIPSLQRS